MGRAASPRSELECFFLADVPSEEQDGEANGDDARAEEIDPVESALHIPGEHCVLGGRRVIDDLHGAALLVESVLDGADPEALLNARLAGHVFHSKIEP